MKLIEKGWTADEKERTLRLEDAENLAAGDGANLGNPVAVTKEHADLRRSKALLGSLANEVVHLHYDGEL